MRYHQRIPDLHNSLGIKYAHRGSHRTERVILSNIELDKVIKRNRVYCRCGKPALYYVAGKHICKECLD